MGSEEDFTVFCGNIAPTVTEAMIYELFLQAGPLKSVRLVKGKGFAFIEYKHSCAVDYAAELFKGTCLHNRELTVRNSNRPQNNMNQRSQSRGGYDSYNRSDRSYGHNSSSQISHDTRNFVSQQHMLPSVAILPQFQLPLLQHINPYHNAFQKNSHQNNSFQNNSHQNNAYQHNSSTSHHSNSSNYRNTPYERHNERHGFHSSDRHSEGHRSNSHRSGSHRSDRSKNRY